MSSRSNYIKAKRDAANREAAFRDPLNQTKVSRGEPTGLKGLLGGKKTYFDRLTKESNAIADKKMMMNRLPNAASSYKDYPNNRT